MTKPLFVSYTGNQGGKLAKGWVVLEGHHPLCTPADITELVEDLERVRGYDPGSMILVSFQRLEDPS